ncbi:MAG: EamA family transporter RarD [Anaerolineales bacterium]|nr:EamA family transporter RarD [Anaerolineales bacterium]
MNKGIVYGLTAYGLWGLLPIYWKYLQQIPATEILAHRMVWSLVFVVILLAYQGKWSWLKPALQNKRVVLTYFVAGAFLALNWGVYIWAVNAGFIIETSLGYFINPLVNVLFGFLFLGERLRPWQIAAVGVAAAGVLYLTYSYGTLPWIALTLAFSFGIYGLLKKKATLNSLEGFSLETALLFLPALGYLLYRDVQGIGSFGHVDLTTTILLALTGIATAVPLILFAAAAKRTTLTALGIMQYIAPTMQFLLGIYLYREPFSQDRLIGFVLIWVALVIYTAESLILNRRKARRLRQAQNPLI